MTWWVGVLLYDTAVQYVTVVLCVTTLLYDSAVLHVTVV
jgi:hypothetical protein